jgi:hypothetical protein
MTTFYSMPMVSRGNLHSVHDINLGAICKPKAIRPT